MARRRLVDFPKVEVVRGAIPDAIPDREYDLVVASEILYYLDGPRLAETLDVLHSLTRPGTRVVAVHWRPAGPERPFTAAEVHGLVRRQGWLSPMLSAPTDDYLLDVLERR